MRHLAILIALACLVGAWWAFHRWDPPPETADTAVAPSATEPAAEPQTRKKNGPPHGFSKSMATVSLPPGTKPSGNIISFRVVHGLAIAYGDLILGTPEDTSLDSGFYEAPRPTLWDRGEVPYLISPDLRVSYLRGGMHRLNPLSASI